MLFSITRPKGLYEKSIKITKGRRKQPLAQERRPQNPSAARRALGPGAPSQSPQNPQLLKAGPQPLNTGSSDQSLPLAWLAGPFLHDGNPVGGSSAMRWKGMQMALLLAQGMEEPGKMSGALWDEPQHQAVSTAAIWWRSLSPK
jgi:hypothetical protein